jgi:hypothetical protein
MADNLGGNYPFRFFNFSISLSTCGLSHSFDQKPSFDFFLVDCDVFGFKTYHSIEPVV